MGVTCCYEFVYWYFLPHELRFFCLQVEVGIANGFSFLWVFWGELGVLLVFFDCQTWLLLVFHWKSCWFWQVLIKVITTNSELNSCVSIGYYTGSLKATWALSWQGSYLLLQCTPRQELKLQFKRGCYNILYHI